MKKSNNIISDWLDKYGDPEIDKKVEEELERMTNKEILYIIWEQHETSMKFHGLMYGYKIVDNQGNTIQLGCFSENLLEFYINKYFVIYETRSKN